MKQRGECKNEKQKTKVKKRKRKSAISNNIVYIHKFICK
jgi:hypothetical protein